MCYRPYFCGLIAVNIVTCPDHSTSAIPEGHILSNGLWRKIAHSVDLSESLEKTTKKRDLLKLPCNIIRERIQTWLLRVE